jgi:hypothetical protein
MAYMSQERKAKLVKAAKIVLKKYGVKATFGVSNHSTIVCNIKSGKIDFIKNYTEVSQADNYLRNAFMYNPPEPVTRIDVNPYHYRNHFSGKARKFMEELFAALNNGNWDKSDIQTDYFNVGWYVDVNVGKWNKPYILEK